MLFCSISKSLCTAMVIALLLQGSSCGKGNITSPPTTSNGTVTNVNAETPQKNRALAHGVWGGEHVSMEVAEDGATLEFDCAHGQIEGRLVANEEGKLLAKGRYAREHGGPVRQDEDQSGEPATYSGKSDGKTLTLTITLDGSNEEVGTFTLTRGKQGRVRKCL